MTNPDNQPTEKFGDTAQTRAYSNAELLPTSPSAWTPYDEAVARSDDASSAPVEIPYESEAAQVIRDYRTWAANQGFQDNDTRTVAAYVNSSAFDKFTEPRAARYERVLNQWVSGKIIVAEPQKNYRTRNLVIATIGGLALLALIIGLAVGTHKDSDDNTTNLAPSAPNSAVVTTTTAAAQPKATQTERQAPPPVTRTQTQTETRTQTQTQTKTAPPKTTTQAPDLKLTPVPNVVGMTVAQAKVALRARGFAEGSITDSSGNTVTSSSAIVTATDPQPGAKINLEHNNNIVDLTVQSTEASAQAN